MSVTEPLGFDRYGHRRKGLSGESPGRWVQYMWIRAQVWAPTAVQDRVLPVLHDAKEIVRLLIRPKLTIYRLESLNESSPLAVDYIGSSFARPLAEMIFFDEKPAVHQIGVMPFWRRAALTNGNADVVVVSSSRRLIRTLPRQNALVLPEFVHHELDLGGDWEDVQSRFHSGVRREQRLMRRYNYQYELSHERRDLETFYQNMYLPTISNRYGDEGLPMPLGEAYEYLGHGTLFKVMRDGEWVSSSLCYARQGVMRFVIMGVLNGDLELIKEGVVGAMNCLRLQWAHENGYRAVNFLGTKPCLNVGLFQYKRKWGTTVRVPSSLHRRMWLQIRRVTPAVADCLKRNPLIVLDEDQSLHGLITVDDLAQVTEGIKKDWIKHYMTPGLKSLRVYTVNQFMDGEVGTAPPQLIIPAELASSSS